MISGREALQDIRQALSQEQQRLRELDSRLKQSNDQLLQLDAQRANELQKLARLRLRFLATGERAASGGDAEGSVVNLLEARNAAYQAVQGRLSELEKERERFEERLAAAADERQRIADEIGRAELATQERLQQDEGYQRQLAAATEADRIAQQAEAKAAQSEAELESKGAAYRADPLFAYLWRRGYGTSAYRPGGGPFAPLLRWLDGKVARLIGYADARPNYHRLQELPERLREHAERVRERADAEFEALRRLDVQGRVDDGIPELEERLKQAEQGIEELEAAQAGWTERNQQALDELEAFAQGTDDNYRKAVTLLRDELEEAPLEVLRSEALATPSPDDDVIVARLRDLTREREQLARTAAEMKESAAQHRQRLAELEKLRADFTRAGMDAPNSAFQDERVVSAALSQFLSGLLTAEALWRLLSQQRVFTRTGFDPDFGSGGFGRGTVWGGGRYPQRRSEEWEGFGEDLAGDIIGGILGGLIGGMLGGGRDRGRGGGFGGGLGGGGGFGGGLGGGSRPSGGGGRFKTGGKVGGGRFKTGGKF